MPGDVGEVRPRRTRLCEQRPNRVLATTAKQAGFLWPPSPRTGLKRIKSLITRLRLDASLFEPAPKRRKGHIGLPAVKGKRRPKLNAILVPCVLDPDRFP